MKEKPNEPRKKKDLKGLLYITKTQGRNSKKQWKLLSHEQRSEKTETKNKKQVLMMGIIVKIVSMKKICMHELV
jgi:hypothetical protein